MARAGVLERGEALICLEGLRELDDAGHVLAVVGEIVELQTIMKVHGDASSKQGRRWLLTPIRKRIRATHLMDCNVVFTLSISLIATMPSAV